VCRLLKPTADTAIQYATRTKILKGYGFQPASVVKSCLV